VVNVLDAEGATNLLNDIMKLWVNPEIERRKQNGTLQSPLIIQKCLITFPKGSSPIVKFNEEFGWEVWAKKAPGTAFEKGQAIHLHEIVSIDKVKLPNIDGKPLAFVYFVREGLDSFRIFFDFSPNHPNFQPSAQENTLLGKQIAESLQAKLVEQAINVQVSCQKQLQKIGLWTAPSLLPYPLSSIVFQLEKNDIDGAKSTLISYCTPDFFSKISLNWWTLKEFELRKPLIESAMSAHKDGIYTLSIPALLPQIEGIVTDWIYTQTPENLPWRIESKTKKFHKIVLSKPTPWSYQCIVNSTINFILGGPVLSTFKRWVNEIETAFPNRHVVEHGKYDPSLYTEENSLKLLLLIDTLYYIISKQSDR
jgi:hypothetical protein